MAFKVPSLLRPSPLVLLSRADVYQCACMLRRNLIASLHTGTAVRAQVIEGPGRKDGVSLVQGASRGLGLEFITLLQSTFAFPVFMELLVTALKIKVRQLLDKFRDGNVIATCRDPGSAESLLNLKEQYADRLTLLPLDVTKESTIEAAAKTIMGQHGRLDLLINTAGILHVSNLNIHPETSLGKIDPEALLLTYQINAMGPILVTKHMAALLKVGGGKDTGRPAAIVANLSARVGSIGDNRLGGWYSYRASKTALNQLTKTASVEFARKKDPILCILLHPGTVNTDLSKPFQRSVPDGKLFTREYSVDKLLGVINGVSVTDNGKFFAWDGQEIPW